ncbi:hypothetical protein EDD18DRAFT_1112454 [Armillaria luteobubalina]|uniref:Uncharacterized protein n=1 Tax=Armillaria luteobubalina TaxID=153913 RepID=A0AA39PEY8_9AGAR|nr:hypothetical protein EDD18DRAFT_1112454 [Armillaria luteobubalina]
MNTDRVRGVRQVRIRMKSHRVGSCGLVEEIEIRLEGQVERSQVFHGLQCVINEYVKLKPGNGIHWIPISALELVGWVEGCSPWHPWHAHYTYNITSPLTPTRLAFDSNITLQTPKWDNVGLDPLMPEDDLEAFLGVTDQMQNHSNPANDIEEHMQSKKKQKHSGKDIEITMTKPVTKKACVTKKMMCTWLELCITNICDAQRFSRSVARYYFPKTLFKIEEESWGIEYKLLVQSFNPKY